MQINLLHSVLCKGSQLFGKAGVSAGKDDILQNLIRSARDNDESIVPD